MKRTTKILVLGETWHVPRGFGRCYTRMAAHELKQDNSASLSDLLLLVGYEVTPAVVMSWPLRKRVEAAAWAATEYARAGDNPVRRHPPLAWLPRPWQGPATAYSGVTGTVIS